jgi:hypothetical protein
MGLMPELDLKALQKAAETIAPALIRIADAWDAHNAIEWEKLQNAKAQND